MCVYYDVVYSGKFFEVYIEEVMVELFFGIVECIDM